jgi:hypothetical protein
MAIAALSQNIEECELGAYGEVFDLFKKTEFENLMRLSF